MADPIDRAQEHIEREAPYILAARKPVPIKACGHCHNCQSPISVGLYCDEDCRSDYEYRAERGIK
jgi:hypothetical protein